MSECRISLALTVSILLWGNVPPDGFFSLSCHRRARSSVCLRDKSAACYNLGSINRKKFVSSAKKTGKNLGQMVLSWAASKFSVLMRTTRRGQVFQCRSLVRGSWDQHPDGAKPLLTSHFSSPELRVSEDLSVLARLPFTSCAPGTGGPFSGLTLSDFLPFSIPERQPSMSSAVPSCSVEGNRRVTHALRGLMPATAIEAE